MFLLFNKSEDENQNDFIYGFDNKLNITIILDDEDEEENDYQKAKKKNGISVNNSPKVLR